MGAGCSSRSGLATLLGVDAESCPVVMSVLALSPRSQLVSKTRSPTVLGIFVRVGVDRTLAENLGGHLCCVDRTSIRSGQPFAERLPCHSPSFRLNSGSSFARTIQPANKMLRNMPTFLRISILGVCALAFAACIASLVFIEPTVSNACFALSITFLIAVSFVFIFKRIFLACFLTALITWLICGVSYFKQQLMQLGLHAYDFVLYSNLDTLEFVWHSYRIYLLSLILVLVGGAVVAAAIWRIDPTRPSRIISALLIAAAIAPVSMLANATSSTGRPTWQMFLPDPPISYFYVSWSETLRSLWTGRIIEADTTTKLPSFAPMPQCNSTSDTPNVILIHQESLFPPSIYPVLNYDHILDSFFLSDDQKLHKLRVEIFGGGSWMSDMSVLMGLPTNSFGYMAAFLQVFLRGKLKETMPQVFSACGFRNELFFPADANFVSMDGFYKSIGFNRVFDNKAQGSTNFSERDRFYFANALDEIDRELKVQDTPTFTYVQTMASHGPYFNVFMPNEHVPGGGPGTSPEWNEYLRRLAMAKMDFEFLTSELKRRFPNRKFLIVRYGDHQPAEARPLWVQSTHDAGWFTFYAMTGVNYVVPPLPQYESLDIGYLGTMMLYAAGIPLPQSHEARMALMKECNGRYYSCEHQQDVLAFHGRMIHSGLIETP